MKNSSTVSTDNPELLMPELSREGNWFARKTFFKELRDSFDTSINTKTFLLHENQLEADFLVEDSILNSKFWVEQISGNNGQLGFADLEEFYLFLDKAIVNDYYPITVCNAEPTEMALEVINNEDLPILFTKDFSSFNKINTRIKSVVDSCDNSEKQFQLLLDEFKAKYAAILAYGKE